MNLLSCRRWRPQTNLPMVRTSSTLPMPCSNPPPACCCSCLRPQVRRGPTPGGRRRRRLPPATPARDGRSTGTRPPVITSSRLPCWNERTIGAGAACLVCFADISVYMENLVCTRGSTQGMRRHAEQNVHNVLQTQVAAATHPGEAPAVALEVGGVAELAAGAAADHHLLN